MTDQLARLQEALADRYAVQRELGRGGMATVYLAQDLKHEREVAVKVFRPELAASIGADRFLREIRITAKFNHPHILPLLDSGEADGLLYYVMPFVEGETLRDRLNREGQFSLDDSLQITREVAAALGYAHSHGVIHRDVKPENVLLSAGEAVVADFGIARAVSEAAEGRLTETGISIGTPAYMSPEQASGDSRVDARSDIYALGCMLYEMLSGDAPYTASTPQAVLVKKLTEPTPRISVVRETVPAAVEAALTKALAKTPADRFPTAQQFAEALTIPANGIAQLSGPAAVSAETPGAELVRALTLRWLASRLRRPRVAVPTAVALLALAGFAAWFVPHRAKVRWARQVALPEIARLIGENDVWRNLVPPYRLAERAEAILGNDPQLATLFSQVSLKIDVKTQPAGARVYMKEYGAPDSAWSYLGVSPLEKVRVPIGIFRWKLEKEGYDTVLAAASTWDAGGPDLIVPYTLVRTLDTAGSVPPGMVRVQSTKTDAGTLPDFFIDKYEVTNRAFKVFVDAGGYRRPEYWKHPFVKDGRLLTWDEAMRQLVDASGQPGPSTWLGGDYPQGQGDYPVSGVSWYEAAAYAEYAGKSLPTDAHWDAARGGFTPMIQWPQLGGFAVLAPFANFGGQGPVPVGTLPGITAYGAYDMAGNVREWCWNETPQGRLIRGGAWNDNTYEFGNRRQAPPMDRSARNGVRLAVYPAREKVPAAAFGVQALGESGSSRTQPPVSDAIFQVYREQFAYDPTPLNARVEYREQSPGGWIREKISFDAAYGGERVLAYLFLPANTPPPYQTVIYFPGSASTWMPSSENLESYYEFAMFLSFLVRNGRAVLYPVYKGTFERGSPALSALSDGAESHAYTEYLVQVVKDFRRSIDYLETRPDIDSKKLAYYGMSWGGYLGSIIPAVEQRLGASVLVAGGFGGRARPEALDLNYATRVRTPTLMLNGRYDNIFDVERQVKPMFELLGTPAADKRLIFYDTDHIPPRAEYIKETLAWLDKYLGPVGR
jgi:formylglycine-generating enzyme required for sulfatase activity/tRNA A-37 threonylcarbamoyl transferase component Bud32/dienelactone hydrolase